MTNTTRPSRYGLKVCNHEEVKRDPRGPISESLIQKACPRCHGRGYYLPELRVLTLWQPWASLMQWGDKCVETRTARFPAYIGWVAISAAAKRLCPNEIDIANESYTQRAMARARVTPDTLVRGAILCVVRFTEYEPTTSAKLHLNPSEIEFGDYSAGRVAIHTADLHALPRAIPWKGAQGLQRAPGSLCTAIAEQLQGGAK